MWYLNQLVNVKKHTLLAKRVLLPWLGAHATWEATQGLRNRRLEYWGEMPPEAASSYYKNEELYCTIQYNTWKRSMGQIQMLVLLRTILCYYLLGILAATLLSVETFNSSTLCVVFCFPPFHLLWFILETTVSEMLSSSLIFVPLFFSVSLLIWGLNPHRHWDMAFSRESPVIIISFYLIQQIMLN